MYRYRVVVGLDEYGKDISRNVTADYFQVRDGIVVFVTGSNEHSVFVLGSIIGFTMTRNR